MSGAPSEPFDLLRQNGLETSAREIIGFEKTLLLALGISSRSFEVLKLVNWM